MEIPTNSHKHTHTLLFYVHLFNPLVSSRQLHAAKLWLSCWSGGFQCPTAGEFLSGASEDGVCEHVLPAIWGGEEASAGPWFGDGCPQPERQRRSVCARSTVHKGENTDESSAQIIGVIFIFPSFCCFVQGFLSDWCKGSFPRLPEEGVAAVVGHLTGSEVMCYVARNLAVEDLTMSAEFPVPDETLQGTFFAVIGALEQSSGPVRAGLFLRVRQESS